MCLNMLLAAAGLRLLIRPGRYRLLLLAAWLWCILTALGSVYMVLASFINRGGIGYLPFSILHSAIQAVCPVMVVVLLSEYRNSEQIFPQPVVPPAFKRWPGQS